MQETKAGIWDMSVLLGEVRLPKYFLGNEFEALKLRYEDQVQLLRTLTDIDHKMVIAFFTLQLALGGWLATQESVASHLRWSLLIIDLTIALIFSKLLFNNHRRRQEVADTIKNVNKGLGFDEAGAYLDKEPLNPPYKRRYWVRWYVAAVVVSCLGILMMLYPSLGNAVEKLLLSLWT